MAKLMKYMTEPELGEHLTKQLRFIKSCQTSDTIGSMLVIFQDDGITQYGATVDPETAPQVLRELADRCQNVAGATDRWSLLAGTGEFRSDRTRVVGVSWRLS